MKLKLGSIPELKNINVMASPDFGVIFDEKKYLIIDWKSGQEKNDSDGVSDQLKISLSSKDQVQQCSLLYIFPRFLWSETRFRSGFCPD